jgi:hypothetical protein
MAVPLNTCTTIEQHGVMRFLWAKNMDAAKDIHKEMLPIWALTMHLPINVKSPNNISKWQMEFNSAFKGLKHSVLMVFGKNI